MTKNYPKSVPLAAVLPAIELLEGSRQIAEEAVMDIGMLALKTILDLSAIELAGEPRRGKLKPGDVRHHGSQPGSVRLGGRRVQVERPRLRTRSGEEAEVPAYELLRQDPRKGERALKRVLKGVSTRDYKGVFDEAGYELGLSRSNVSRQTSAAAEEALAELAERKIATRQLAVMVDGVGLGECLAAVAIGVDEAGAKRGLGIAEGATESAAVVGSLLDSLIEKGLSPEAPVLFVIDGSKALRKAVKDRFSGAVVQRCRIHKMRNVIEHLPLAKRRAMQAKLSLAYRLPYEEALEKLQEIAEELQALHPGAAASLREGLEETLTVSRLGLSALFVTSLSSTNLIESSFSRAKHRLRKITNYPSGAMAMKWCASALLMAESGFRTLKGAKDLWMLKAALGTPPAQVV